jgi:hypothetical protein
VIDPAVAWFRVPTKLLHADPPDPFEVGLNVRLTKLFVHDGLVPAVEAWRAANATRKSPFVPVVVIAVSVGVVVAPDPVAVAVPCLSNGLAVVPDISMNTAIVLALDVGWNVTVVSDEASVLVASRYHM